MSRKETNTPFAIMGRDDPDIELIRRWSGTIRQQHFKNFKEVKRHLWNYCHMYYVGDISPLTFYREMLHYMDMYEESATFITHRFENMYFRFFDLYENEKFFSENT